MKRTRQVQVIALLFTLLLGSSVFLGIAAAAAPSAQVSLVAAGFDNPRGVAISDGDILVGESGHGGDICIPSIYGPNCAGLNSQISVVDPKTGAHHPLVSGLFSTIFGAVGPIGVEGVSARDGTVLAILGLNSAVFDAIDCSSQPPDCEAVKAGAKAEAGELISVSKHGTWRAIASVGKADLDNFSKRLAENPQQKDESNPFGVLATSHGAYVANAAAGTLDFVSKSGDVDLVHYFQFHPPAGAFPSDEVPTCVVRAHGHVWMGDLNGRLFRMDGSTPTQIPVVDSTGQPLLHHVTGCGTSNDGDGAIYLVNLWTTGLTPTPGTGSVIRYDVARNSALLVAPDLNFPNMLAVGGDRTLYVSANSVCPASGGPSDACNALGQTSGVLLKIKLPERN